MYISAVTGLGQQANNSTLEADVLKQLLANGLRVYPEINGQRNDIFLPPTTAKLPYYTKQVAEAQEYLRLAEPERKMVTDIVDQAFREGTGISRKLDPKNPNDLPWIRTWLRLRDQIMVRRSRGPMQPPQIIRAQFAPSSQSTTSAPQIFRAQFGPSTTPAPQNTASQLTVDKTRNDNEIFVTKTEGMFATRYMVRRIPRIRAITVPSRAGICWKDGRVFARVTWCGATQGTLTAGTDLPGQTLDVLQKIGQIGSPRGLQDAKRIIENTRVETFVDLLWKMPEKNLELKSNFRLEVNPRHILSTKAAAAFDTRWVGVGGQYNKDSSGENFVITVDFHDKRSIQGKKCEQFAIWWEPMCYLPTKETLYLYFQKGKDILTDDPKLGTTLLNRNTLARLEALVSRGYWLEAVKGYTSPEGLRPKASTFEGNVALSEKRAQMVLRMIENRYYCMYLPKTLCMSFPRTPTFTKHMPKGVGHSELPKLDVKRGKALKELEGKSLDIVMINGDQKAVDPEQRLSFLERYPEEFWRMTEEDRNIVMDTSKTVRDRAEKLFENLRRVEIHLRYGVPLHLSNTFPAYYPASHCPDDVVAKAQEVWGLPIPLNRFDTPLCD